MPPLRSFAVASFRVATLLALGRSLEAGGGSGPHRSLNAFDSSVVERVRSRAAARLNEPECGKLLGDFTDREGRTLQANLQKLGVSASVYLRRLTFLDGSRLAACRSRMVAMATARGTPYVFVCPSATGGANSRLARIEFESGSLAEAMVIHEMLHALGLGENPPSTFEITDRVRQRCR